MVAELLTGGPHLLYLFYREPRLTGRVRARGRVDRLPFVCVEEERETVSDAGIKVMNFGDFPLRVFTPFQKPRIANGGT